MIRNNFEDIRSNLVLSGLNFVIIFVNMYNFVLVMLSKQIQFRFPCVAGLLWLSFDTYSGEIRRKRFASTRIAW